jgi:hypothetical protein
MLKYIVIYASYLETEGMDASVLIFDTEEQAQQNIKESYDIILKDFENGSIIWNDLDKNSYSVGGYDSWSNHMRCQAYIDKKEV